MKWKKNSANRNEMQKRAKEATHLNNLDIGQPTASIRFNLHRMANAHTRTQFE